MTPIIAVIAALVVYRLSMLVVADTITEPLRDRIIERYVHPVHELTYRPPPEPFAVPGSEWAYMAECRCGTSWVGEEWGDVMSPANQHVNEHRGEMTDGPRWLPLLECHWCVSFWLAWPVVWTAWCFGDRAWWFVPSGTFAASAVTGIIATFAKPPSNSSR